MVLILFNKNRDVTANRGECINPEKENRAAITCSIPTIVQDVDLTMSIMLQPNEENQNCPILSIHFFYCYDQIFVFDYVTVETTNHTRLKLKLSYNWQFKGEKNQDNGAKLLYIPDFIGDMCKSIASKVRGTLSSVSFDNFHKNSADIFALPYLETTRQIIQRESWIAKGRLERQRITDEAQAEKSRKQLLELLPDCAIVEAIGHSSIDVKARAESNKIEAEVKIEDSKGETEALGIEAEAELTRLREACDAEIEYIEKQNKLEIDLKERK
ncbi:MVP [Lepeophtheirus salmonis]|uniref:MVP n=1 Tax=Lepeophtheirus salmonis TaxID=72036 RepID=A0A7R8D6D7_LEPSM|nr:MVP [Lepeophtheirus salmonis]CAF3016498.1 MVP [Lepeophtheirus salmonis]